MIEEIVGQEKPIDRLAKLLGVDPEWSDKKPTNSPLVSGLIRRRSLGEKSILIENGQIEGPFYERPELISRLDVHVATVPVVADESGVYDTNKLIESLCNVLQAIQPEQKKPGRPAKADNGQTNN